MNNCQSIPRCFPVRVITDLLPLPPPASCANAQTMKTPSDKAIALSTTLHPFSMPLSSLLPNLKLKYEAFFEFHLVQQNYWKPLCSNCEPFCCTLSTICGRPNHRLSFSIVAIEGIDLHHMSVIFCCKNRVFVLISSPTQLASEYRPALHIALYINASECFTVCWQFRWWLAAQNW